MSIMKGCERKVIEYLCRCLGLRWSCFIQQKEKAATSVWQRRNRLHSWIDSMVNLISMYASDRSQCCSIKVLIFARGRPFYQTEISLAICCTYWCFGCRCLVQHSEQQVPTGTDTTLHLTPWPCTHSNTKKHSSCLLLNLCISTWRECQT